MTLGRSIGSASAAVVPVVNPASDKATIVQHGNALGISLAGRYEFVPRVSGIVRVGMAYTHTKERGENFAYSGSATGFGPTLGLALNIALPWGWSAEFGLDRIRTKFPSKDNSLDIVSLGISQDF